MNDSKNTEIKTPDDKIAMAFFRSLRWVNGVYCPQCKSYDIVNRGQQGRVRRYSCKNCKSNFNDFTGTIFHKSRIPMGMMLYVLFNMNDKTITQLSEETGYSRQCISRLKHLFEKKLLNNPEFCDKID
ncbi:MAG: transposase [Methanobrevibacter wolinii]|nr:transposase [Methanobrevibacter wolinii]